jgi:hypothetical protein
MTTDKLAKQVADLLARVPDVTSALSAAATIEAWRISNRRRSRELRVKGDDV